MFSGALVSVNVDYTKYTGSTISGNNYLILTALFILEVNHYPHK